MRRLDPGGSQDPQGRCVDRPPVRRASVSGAGLPLANHASRLRTRPGGGMTPARAAHRRRVGGTSRPPSTHGSRGACEHVPSGRSCFVDWSASPLSRRSPGCVYGLLLARPSATRTGPVFLVLFATLPATAKGRSRTTAWTPAGAGLIVPALKPHRVPLATPRAVPCARAGPPRWWKPRARSSSWSMLPSMHGRSVSTWSRCFGSCAPHRPARRRARGAVHRRVRRGDRVPCGERRPRLPARAHRAGDRLRHRDAAAEAGTRLPARRVERIVAALRRECWRATEIHTWCRVTRPMSDISVSGIHRSGWSEA